MCFFWNNTTNLSACAVITPDGQTLTYEQLFRKADEFSIGLKPNSLILIQASNNLASLTAYLSCLRNGHIAMLISREISIAMKNNIVIRYSPDYVYSPNERGEYSLAYNEYKNRETNRFHPDLALLLSTSGSTGSPKFVRLTRDNIHSNASAIAKYLNLTNKDRAITNLPLFYSYGLSIINSHLNSQGTILLTEESITSPSFWFFFDAYKSTSLAGVPFTYEMLELIRFRDKKIPHLRYITQAGGKLSPEIILRYAQWAKERNIDFFVMYGQTEATARMSYLPIELALQYPDSIGKPIPGGNFYILDEDNNIINTPEVSGELIYTGENVCYGYAEDANDLALGDNNNKTLYTGDIAKFDENGLYYITGRKKRFLKIAGNRFALDELESLFQQNNIPAVCGGVDTKLIVAVTDDQYITPAATFLKSTWKLQKSQYKIIVVKHIPRSETGKILYAKLFEDK